MDDLAAKITIPAPADMAKGLEDALYKKASMPKWKIFWLGLTGGAFIAFGFIMYVTTQQGTPAGMPVGVTKMIGGALFATGLIMVIVSGSDLFTSTTLNIVPLLSKRITAAQALTHWVTSYCANFIGSIVIAALIFLGGVYETNNGAWGAVVLKTSLAKLHHDFVSALALGILCNILVCMAVWLTYAGRTFTDKVFAITIPLVIFVSSGFEHSVANMFMLPMGWLIKTFAPAEFWASDAVVGAHLSPAAVEHITWGNIVFHNLLPVTLGNIIGGGIVVGGYFWVAYRKDAIKAERAAVAAGAASAK